MPEPSFIERLKRARVVRALGVYLAASWVVLEVTATLEDVLGLPDWTAAVAFVLLLSGLVVIFATAWVQSHPAVEAREAAGELPDDWDVALGDLGRSLRAGRMPHLTWGRALAGGVVVFAMLFGLAGGYVLFSPEAPRPGPAPLAAEAAAAPGVAVVPFSVSGPELDLWREGLVDLLATNLDGLGGLRGIDSRTVLARWSEAVPAGGQPDLDTMLGVARSAEARWALIGSVVGADRVRLVADAYDLRTGAKLGTARAEGEAHQMMALVDELSVGIAALLLARDPEDGGVQHLSSVTTSSLPALEAYLQGEALYRRSEYEQAIDRYREAVAQDSTFALAWMRLHDAYGWTQVGGDAYNDAADRAARYQDRLPVREKLLVRSDAAFSRSTLDLLPELEAAARRYPDDPEIVYEVGEYYVHFGGQAVPSVDSALATFEKAVALDPTFGPYYVHTVDLAIMAGDSARAAELLEVQGRVAPNDRHHAGSRLAHDLVFGSDATRASAWERLESRPREHNWAVVPLMGLQTAHLGERVAEITLDTDSPVVPTAYLLALTHRGKIRAAARFARGTPDRAAAVVVSARAPRLPLPTDLWQPPAPATTDNPSALMALGLAAIDGEPGAPPLDAVRGRIDEIARDVLAADDTANARRWTALGTALDGVQAWRAGNPDGARTDLERALPRMPAWSPGAAQWVEPASAVRWWLAEVNAELGRLDDAARHYERLFLDGIFTSLAQYRLGDLYERLGRTEDARRAFAAFARAWEEADPELQPMVDHARDRLAGLTEEGA